VLAYTGDARRLVQALKYRNGRAVAPALGAAMARLVAQEPVDEVTWAPTSGTRRRARGYDQAQVLARAVARHLGVPCRPLLRRRGPSRAQTGRPRADRLADAPLFAVVRRPQPSVVVVDDVVTTGATLHAACRALVEGGAEHVRAVAAAATP
jgi:predicted amidophosphoribosyltransferase